MHFSLKFSDLLKSKEVQVLDSPRGLLTLQPDNLLQQVPGYHYTKSDIKTKNKPCLIIKKSWTNKFDNLSDVRRKNFEIQRTRKGQRKDEQNDCDIFVII